MLQAIACDLVPDEIGDQPFRSLTSLIHDGSVVGRSAPVLALAA